MTHSGSPPVIAIAALSAAILLLFKVKRETGCDQGEAIKRRLIIEIHDAVGKCIDFIWGKYACEARFRIDKEVSGFAVVAFKQLFEPGKGLLDAGGVLTRLGRLIGEGVLGDSRPDGLLNRAKRERK